MAPLFHGSLPAALAVGSIAIMSHAATPAPLLPYNTEAATNGPMPAAEVVVKTQLPPGFRLSVFATEPDVQQPIAMATIPRLILHSHK